MPLQYLRMLQPCRSLEPDGCMEATWVTMAPFDVVVTFEERIMEVVLEDMEGRQAASRSLIPVSYSQLSQHGQAAVESVGAGAGFRPCLVVNLDVKDSTDEAALAAPQALKLCSMIAAFAKGKDGCWEAGVEAVLDTFHKETGRRPIYGGAAQPTCQHPVRALDLDTANCVHIRSACPPACRLPPITRYGVVALKQLNLVYAGA
ncbi:hypothetical protein QJQ45_021046 [Haematococcus lacustris]|nr:hypothetical protein QJQ45_021046 [Haematococcus lacustris]